MGFALVANAFDVPALTGPVVDQAGMLDSRVEAAISDAARALVSKGGSQVQVLTVRSLDGMPLEQASIMVTDKWKLGTTKGDRGVLLFVSAEDRAVRIEVGQGNEGVLTDAQSKRIVEDVIIPFFKAGDFNSGIASGFIQIAKITDPQIEIGNFFDGSRRNFDRAPQRSRPGLSIWFFILLFIIMIFNGIFRPPGRRRGFYGGGWGGGLGGGGFGGFGGGGGGSWGGGGGGFSGGGASGRW